MNNPTRTYFRRFTLAMLGYALALAVSIWLLRQMGDTPWRIVVAIVPVLPVAYGLLAVVHHLGYLDELQQRIQLQALAFASGLTAITTFTYGFLENAGFPRLSWIWVLPLICLYWGLGIAVAERRYR